MIKAAIIAIALTMLVACGDAPRPVNARNENYSVVSERPDPSAGSLTVVITIPRSFEPQQIRAAAESVIASRKDRYRAITVKSFFEDSGLDGQPYAVSRLENGSVDHAFGDRRGGAVRIPTH